MEALIKNTELRAASFSNGIVKLEIQTSLVVSLLKKAIIEERVLSKDDVIECYLDFVFHGGKETVYRCGLDSRQWNPAHTGIVTRDYLKNTIPRYTERLAMDWFRKHLGSAILKGKLLAIPVIDIE